MGRPRVADRDALLDAAETVIRRDGAGRLTLGAVAAAAGVSKASVLYECQSKHGLVRALVERRAGKEGARIASRREELGPVRNAAIRAQIDVAADGISPEERDIQRPLVVALAEDGEDGELLGPLRGCVEAWMTEIGETCETPRGALLAFLALEGINGLERLDLHRFRPEDRRRLLAEIAWLAEQTPATETTGNAAEDRDAATRHGGPECALPHTSQD